MADPGAHVAVIGDGLFSRVGCQQVQLPVFPGDREAVFFGQAFKAGGQDALFIIGQVFQGEFVSEDTDLVVRQFHSRVLMAAVHFHIPGFLPVRDHGDVDFAAAVLVQQGRKHGNSLPGSGALADDQVNGGKLAQPVLHQGIGRKGCFV